ncbi:MAG TPA: DNA polymerase III subunit chi, partial [Devosia sp.]|nr:DNA polymerase III subunit chi [Devosia sp.]
MVDILFYHLEQRPLEAVIPQLLEKTLERGWRAVIEVGSSERAEA